MAVVSGPFRDLKWGGIVLRPSKDSGASIQVSGFEFEHDMSPNEDVYSKGSAVVGYVEQECAMTFAEYSDLKKLQDGTARAGTGTLMNGDVASLNCAIDGELKFDDGKVKIKLAGKVKLQ